MTFYTTWNFHPLTFLQQLNSHDLTLSVIDERMTIRAKGFMWLISQLPKRRITPSSSEKAPLFSRRFLIVSKSFFTGFLTGDEWPMTALFFAPAGALLWEQLSRANRVRFCPSAFRVAVHLQIIDAFPPMTLRRPNSRRRTKRLTSSPQPALSTGM